MTWTLVQKSASEAAATSTTVTPTLPGASTAGNLLVCFLLNSSGTATWSLPAGWVQGADVQNGGVSHAAVWYYPANAGGISSVVCTSSASVNIKAGLAEFHTDVASPTVTLNATGTAVGGTVSSLAVTTGTAAASGDLAVCCFDEHFTTATAVTWTDPSGFTLAVSDTASAGNHLYGAYDLSAAAGALTVTGKSSAASDNAHGWTGTAATFTASSGGAPPGSAGMVGAYINPGMYGSGVTMAQAISSWQANTGSSLDVRRVYYSSVPGSTAVPADMQADAAAGRKVAISFRPAWNPPTTADLSTLDTFLSNCKTAGLVMDVSLYPEPYGASRPGGVSAGMTIAQEITAWQFYAPTIRQYYPTVFDTSSYSVNHNNENAWYPGDGYIDKIVTDFYCSEYDGGERLDTAQSLADGAVPPKPFGLWELNSSLNASAGQTKAQATAYFQYVQNYFVARLNASKSNADLILFNSDSTLSQETPIVTPDGGTSSFSATPEYRNALYESLYDAVSAGGSTGGTQISMASEIDIDISMNTSMTTTTAIPAPAPGTPGPSLPQLTAEAGFYASAPVVPAGTFLLDDPVNGRLDTARLGDTTIWTDIAAYVRSGSTVRGSTRQQSPVVQYQPGTAALTLKNGDGRFDPENTAGPYASAGVSQIRPMIPLRIRAIWNGVTYPLWSGFADGWQVSGQNLGPNYEEVAFTGTDALKVFAGITLPAVTLPLGEGEDSGARITRIVNAARWYTDGPRRNITAGDSHLQGTTLGDTAMNLMQLAADTELGELYADENGAVFFRHRSGILEDARSVTSQALFGDSGDGTELEYTALGRADDDTELCNDAQITRNGGIMQEAADATSEAKFLFPRTYTATGLLQRSDAEALAYGQYLVYVSKGAENRFDTITISPRRDPVNLWPQVLGRKIGDRVTIRRRPPPPGSGLLISRDCFIRGIEHDFDFAAQTWTTIWTLQDASRFSFLTLDNTVLGKLDGNALTF